MSDKSNAVTDDEFVETDELLASIPVEAEAMDLAEADGFYDGGAAASENSGDQRLASPYFVNGRSKGCRNGKCGER